MSDEEGKRLMRFLMFVSTMIMLSGAFPCTAEPPTLLKTLSPEAYKAQVQSTDFEAHTVTADKFLEMMNGTNTVVLDLRDEAA